VCCLAPHLNIEKEVTQQQRPDMSGITDINSVLSGLKTKTINITTKKDSNIFINEDNDNESGISINELNDIQNKTTIKTKKRKEKRKLDNIISLNI
jgi:hypothetical protein